MDNNIINLDSVDKYNRLFGLETLHPLVSVVDLSEASENPTHFTINYGVYALYLKETKCGDIRYGKQTYDYQEGTITSFAPGQVTEIEMAEGIKPKAYGILFHPDLIKGTSLGAEIKTYSFFSYKSNEALHISEDGSKTAACFLSRFFWGKWMDWTAVLSRCFPSGTTGADSSEEAVVLPDKISSRQRTSFSGVAGSLSGLGSVFV